MPVAGKMKNIQQSLEEQKKHLSRSIFMSYNIHDASSFSAQNPEGLFFYSNLKL